MKYFSKSAFILLVFCATVTVATTLPHFDHIIIVVQENRTPDNLFQGLCIPPFGTAGSCPSAYNISPNGVKPEDGTLIPLTPVSLADNADPDHGNKSFVQCTTVAALIRGLPRSDATRIRRTAVPSRRHPA